jgi:hypothetical protein
MLDLTFSLASGILQMNLRGPSLAGRQTMTTKPATHLPG